VGVGLLVLAGAFYFSTLRPEKTRLAGLQQEAAQTRQQAGRAEAEGPRTPAEKIAAFYAFFPPPERLPDALEKIFGAAAPQSLVLEHGEYRVVKDSSDRLLQYQVTFPVKGTYPQIRKFVAAALAEVPALALDSVQFERKKVGDAAVDAKVKFVVYLGQAS
jgi:hypothetical protein